MSLSLRKHKRRAAAGIEKWFRERSLLVDMQRPARRRWLATGGRARIAIVDYPAWVEARLSMRAAIGI